jgi:hypothetical protein
METTPMRNIVILAALGMLFVYFTFTDKKDYACTLGTNSYDGSFDTGDAYYADYGTTATEHQFNPERRGAK